MKTVDESALATLAAIFVLFTTMIDPRISSVLAIVLLFGFALYKVFEDRKHLPQS